MGETVYQDPIVFPQQCDGDLSRYDKPFLGDYRFFNNPILGHYHRSTFQNYMSNSGKLISVETCKIFCSYRCDSVWSKISWNVLKFPEKNVLSYSIVLGRISIIFWNQEISWKSHLCVHQIIRNKDFFLKTVTFLTCSWLHIWFQERMIKKFLYWRPITWITNQAFLINRKSK